MGHIDKKPTENIRYTLVRSYVLSNCLRSGFLEHKQFSQLNIENRYKFYDALKRFKKKTILKYFYRGNRAEGIVLRGGGYPGGFVGRGLPRGNRPEHIKDNCRRKVIAHITTTTNTFSWDTNIVMSTIIIHIY